MPSKTIVTGLMQDAGGNLVTSGNVMFSIASGASEEQYYRVTGTAVIVPSVVNAVINSVGQIMAEDGVSPLQIWGNDTLSPSNSWYRIKFAPVDGPVQITDYVLIQGTTYNLNSPVFYDISSFVPDQPPIDVERIQANIIPVTTGQYTLGNSTHYYASAYVQQLFATTTNISTLALSSIRTTNGGSIIDTPIPGYPAFGAFIQNYAANHAVLNEFVHQIIMTNNLSGEKGGSFISVAQNPGSGAMWSDTSVMTSAAGVGPNSFVGREIDINNNNTDWDDPNGATTGYGLVLSGAGSKRSTAAMIIAGVGTIWKRGIYFAGGSAIQTSSIEDEGNAQNAYLMQGVHTYGIKAGAGSFATSVLQMPFDVGITAYDNGAVERNVIKIGAGPVVSVAWSGATTSFGGSTLIPAANGYSFGAVDGSHAAIYGSGLAVFARNAINTAYAAFDALSYAVSGTPGIDFGPALVTSITIRKGIVTACS